MARKEKINKKGEIDRNKERGGRLEEGEVERMKRRKTGREEA